MVRWVVFGIAAYSAYLAFSEAKSARSGWGWIFGGVVLLFNPVIPPVHLSQTAWFPVNIIVIVGFSASIAWEVWMRSKKGHEV
jgi:hypothetical protein